MGPRTSLRSLLGQGPYRRLFVARTVSQWGDAFNTVALVLLIYSLTGSGLGVSGVVIARSSQCWPWHPWPAQWWTGRLG